MVNREIATIIGNNIRRIRIEKGLYQKDFLKSAGLHSDNSMRFTMLRYEKGKGNITGDRLVMIANDLGVSIMDLLRGVPGIDKKLNNVARLEDFLSKEEIKTLNNIRKLNQESRRKVDEYISDISKNTYKRNHEFEQIIEMLGDLIAAKMENI